MSRPNNKKSGRSVSEVDPKAEVVREPASTNSGREFEKVFLRLIKGGSERVAIEQGQIDAVVDHSNGNVVLLPAAQQSLIARKMRLRRLLEISCDWSWEQDERYRFVSIEGTDADGSVSLDKDIIGKTLWELSIDNVSDADWQPLRQQLEWRTPFRDLEVRFMNHAGEVRDLSFSGTPIFDAEGQFKGYRGITRNISERKQTVEVAQEPNRYAHPALDALRTQVAVLDPSGVILWANRAWRTGAVTQPDIGGGGCEGSNYLEACANAGECGLVDGVMITAGIRQVIAGERGHFRCEYDFPSPTGRRWIMLNVTRATGDTGARAVVVREDITRQRRGALLLELEFAVARCLAEADNASAALKAVIRAICESQQWDCGRYFCLDPVADELRFSEAWGVPVAAVAHFLERSRDLVFRPGAGLTGRVFLSGQPLWIHAGAQDAEISPTALAPETGSEDAFIFAVTSEDKAIGVLAFTSSTVLAPDNRMLQAMQSIGRQLGRFLQRQQALDELSRSAVRFRKLIELSVDWYWEQDSDYRFTQYTGANLFGTGGVLGKTLWEFPDVVPSGSEWIKHKSELAARWSFCDFEFTAVQPDGRTGYFCISGEPVYDEAGTFTGYCGTGMNITVRKTAEDRPPDPETTPGAGPPEIHQKAAN